MAKLYQILTDELADFIRAQPLFFVASAPLDPEGHVNLSPKGLDSFRILAPQQVAYLDITGSGNETSAHLAENGRMTFMFCAFTGAPRILRLYGRGRVVLPQAAAWAALIAQFAPYPGIRQIVVADITRIQTSCGFGVPLMDYVQQRDTAPRWAQAKGQDGIVAYQREKNLTSIDGLRTPLATQFEARK
jgi:hypothetical protein